MKKNQLEKSMKNMGIADFYKTQEELDQGELGNYTYIKISEIDDFPNHPYGLHEDSEDMKQLNESIVNNGILNPVLLRPKHDERYEMISGHRRKYVAQLNGLEVIPCIIKNLTDEQATILMIDSNINRENILPSEKAKAYKMRYEAMKHQGKATSRPVGEKLLSITEMSQEVGESERQISRYLQLNNLMPEILKLVDNGKMKLRPAVEISRLSEKEQEELYEIIELEERTPSLEQAIKMKNESRIGRLSDDRILKIMIEQKPNEKDKYILKQDEVRKYVPKSYTPKQVQDLLIELLKQWYKKRQKELER